MALVSIVGVVSASAFAPSFTHSNETQKQQQQQAFQYEKMELCGARAAAMELEQLVWLPGIR